MSSFIYTYREGWYINHGDTMDRTEALEISEIAGNEIVERTKG